MNIILWLLLGLGLALAYIVLARLLWPRQQMTVFAIGLVVAAVIYLWFAIDSGSNGWIPLEALGIGLYGALAWLGITRSYNWLALGWLLHPIWDIALHFLGPGAHIVADWYAIACVSFDVAMAGYIYFLATKTHPISVAQAAGNDPMRVTKHV